MVPRRLWFVPVVAALVLVPLAAGAKAALDARGTLTGSGTSYSLALQNTGDQPIRCMQLWLPGGSRVATVTPPGGWVAGVDSSRSRIGAQSQQGLAPGGSATFAFTTEAAVGSGSSLHVSSDCVSDKTVPVTGPGGSNPPPPPPPPPPKPCKCAKLNVKLDGTLLTKTRVPPDRNDFGVGFQWFMTCSKGAGTCKGTIAFKPPEILAGTLPEPKQNLRLNIKKLSFVCQGPCTKSKTGKFQAKMLSRDQLNVLFGRTLAYTIVTKCGAVTKTVKVKVSVDQNGRLKPAR